MKKLEEKIRECGGVRPGNILKVDMFLNHQIDPEMMEAIGQEFYRLFKDEKVTKILTVEASGIAMAIETARAFGVPMIFAKKSQSKNIDPDVYATDVYSYTHGNTNNVRVSKKYLNSDDCVLIVDDFLANGEAMNGLVRLCEQAGAKVAGCGAAIEKGFQPGGKGLRERGFHVESLAIVDEMDGDTGLLKFRQQEG